MNNETNFKDITRGQTKQLPTDENEAAQFKATLNKESDWKPCDQRNIQKFCSSVS